MPPFILKEQKKAAILIDDVLVRYANELKDILDDKNITEKDRINKVYSQLKLIQKKLEALLPTNKECSSILIDVNRAINGMINENTGIPSNIDEIISELKGEAPPKEKEKEKNVPDKDKKKENNWSDPLSIDVSKPGESLIYLKQNATYENLEKYTKDFNDKFDQLSEDFINEALSFLKPYLISFLANEDYLSYAQDPSYVNKTYGDYVSSQSKNNDCYTYANRKIFEMYENVYLGEDNYLKGTEEKHPISSEKDWYRLNSKGVPLNRKTFYLQTGDAIGKFGHRHWGVVKIENGEIYVVSRGSWKGEGWIHKETLHDFLQDTSSIDIIHYHTGSKYGQYVELDGNTKHGEIMDGTMPNNR